MINQLVNLSTNKKELNNKEGFDEIMKNCTGDCPGYTDTSIISKETFNYNNNNSKIDNKETMYESAPNNNYKYITFILIIVIILLILYIIKLSKK